MNDTLLALSTMEGLTTGMSTSDQKLNGQCEPLENDHTVRMTQELEELELEDSDSASASEDEKTHIEAQAKELLCLPDDQTEEEKTKKKKKRKKRSNGAAKPPKPTGFEDYYVDAPIAPSEYQQEQSLYSSDKSFSDRLCLAIARYSSRRKFNEVRKQIFDKYLAYGGMRTGVKQFQGRVDENAPDMTTTEIAIEKSRYDIKEETLETSVVDFDAVVRGFLTSYLPTTCEAEDTLTATNVVRNFLNYLLYHDVCAEYADQIYDAKKSCDTADHQMPICTDLVQKLPGSFNQACSLIFGGQFQNTYIEDAEQAKSLRLEPGMRREEANKIFLAGLAAHGTEEMVLAYNSQAKENKICIINRKTLYLEVTETCLPSAEVLELYALASQRSIPSTGTVKFQNWQHPHGPWPEMTPEQLRAYKIAPYKREHYELCLEADLLPKMLVGTKICCTYYETSFGLHYCDSVIGVLCPMYTWLDNDAIMDWLSPKEIPPKSKSEDIPDDNSYVVVGGNVPKDNEYEGRSSGNATGEEDDIPPELQKYEKGEDIVVEF